MGPSFVDRYLLKDRGGSVCVEVGGGLGNQLFGLTAGLWASHVLRLGLQVDASPSRPQNLARSERHFFTERNLELDALSLPVSGDGSKVEIVDLPFRPPFKGEMRLRRRWSRLGLPAKDYWPVPWTRDDRLLTVAGHRKLRGNFHSWEYLSALQRAGVRFPLLVHSQSEWLSTMIAQMPPEGAISVHLRLDDYKRVLPQLISSPQFLREAIESAQLHFPEAEVWLFSDEPSEARSIVQAASPRIKPRLIMQPPHVRTGEVMRLLSLSSAIVCSASSFSLWAAHFATESCYVVVPKSGQFLFGVAPLPSRWVVI